MLRRSWLVLCFHCELLLFAVHAVEGVVKEVVEHAKEAGEKGTAGAGTREGEKRGAGGSRSLPKQVKP